MHFPKWNSLLKTSIMIFTKIQELRHKA